MADQSSHGSSSSSSNGFFLSLSSPSTNTVVKANHHHQHHQHHQQQQHQHHHHRLHHHHRNQSSHDYGSSSSSSSSSSASTISSAAQLCNYDHYNANIYHHGAAAACYNSSHIVHDHHHHAEQALIVEEAPASSSYSSRQQRKHSSNIKHKYNINASTSGHGVNDADHLQAADDISRIHGGHHEDYNTATNLHGHNRRNNNNNNNNNNNHSCNNDDDNADDDDGDGGDGGDGNDDDNGGDDDAEAGIQRRCDHDDDADDDDDGDDEAIEADHSIANNIDDDDDDDDDGDDGDGDGDNDSSEMHDMIKGEIVSHPLYEKLLSTHLECLSIGLPHECAKELERQVSGRGHVGFAVKYLAQKQNINIVDQDRDDQDQKHNPLRSHDHLKKDIDEFMRTYLQALTEWRVKMEDSILPQMKKTMEELLEIEHSFCELMGMPCNNASSVIDYRDLAYAESSDDEDQYGATKLTLMGTSSPACNSDPCMKLNSSFTTLMDIKQHLGENYRENIFSIRDAILKKRQGSRLQADITILTNWWNENSNWPYPTEEEKRQMANETGLEMRQINNWFINNRKRKWHRDQTPKK